MSIFMLGRAKVPHRKNTAKIQAEKMPAPSSVTLLTSQHIGAPASPVVKVGDKVFVGTLIAEAQGYVSSPVHSSVSGVVKKLEPHLMYNGRSCQAIVIESDGEMTPDPEIAAPEITCFDELSAAVRASGLVGLGGAGFPTAVKLDAEKKGLIKKIIINGAECEPYITSDTRTMLDDGEYIRRGVELLLKYISADEVIIGIERNKTECISVLTALFEGDSRVTVMALPDTYPQGAEKILIYNTTHLEVPEGGLPADVGCLVMNVTSVAFLAKYAESGMPLVEKRITLDGSAIKAPTNLTVPIGTSIKDVIEYAGGTKCEVGKILYGGPMMGMAVYSDEEPILKNTNAITVLNKKDAAPKKLYPCIHCGRCAETCPMGLNPTLYAKAMKLDDQSDRCARLTDAKINLCMECGCCSFVCPSARPLVETNKLAKAELRNNSSK